MIKYSLAYLFILMSVLYGGISLDSLAGNYCYPNCKKSNSILMINSDSTFNFKTMLYGGFSKAGTLRILKDNKVELKTTQIYSPKKSYQLPPRQIISIISNSKIKIGGSVYIKKMN